jgi:hypothetical protein
MHIELAGTLFPDAPYRMEGSLPSQLCAKMSYTLYGSYAFLLSHSYSHAYPFIGNWRTLYNHHARLDGD